MKTITTKYIVVKSEEVKEIIDKNEAKATYEKWKAEDSTTELKKIILTVEELTYDDLGLWL